MSSWMDGRNTDVTLLRSSVKDFTLLISINITSLTGLLMW